MNTLPCLLCGRQLESVEGDSWQHMQPRDGCEVRIVAAWGSAHDGLDFRAVICDACVSKIVTSSSGEKSG